MAQKVLSKEDLLAPFLFTFSFFLFIFAKLDTKFFFFFFPLTILKAQHREIDPSSVWVYCTLQEEKVQV